MQGSLSGLQGRRMENRGALRQMGKGEWRAVALSGMWVFHPYHVPSPGPTVSPLFRLFLPWSHVVPPMEPQTDHGIHFRRRNRGPVGPYPAPNIGPKNPDFSQKERRLDICMTSRYRRQQGVQIRRVFEHGMDSFWSASD